MEQYYLGFDAGTQSVKTAVYDIDMNLIVQDTNATILNYPHPGWVEMDADQYLHATVTGIRNCVTKMKEKNLDPDNIRSIFGDGIICGIVGVDKDCHAITPYINYLDSRTKEDVEELASHHYEIWAKETGNPQPNCMFPAMFARWMMNNCEGFKEKGRKFMHNAPYILANLAGLSVDDAVIDWGTMSGWGLGYRVTEKKWSKEQLEILGIPMEMMPKIQKPWDIIGTLSETFAKEIGLKPGIPICAGAGDTMQSMIGCGVIKPDQAADVAGTCAMFCIATDGINEELSKPENELIFNSGTLENTYFYWGESLKSDYKKKLESAKTQADQIILDARSRAEAEQEKALERTRQEADSMLEKAKADIASEQDKATKAAEAEIAKLAILAARKIVKTGEANDTGSSK